MTYDNKHDCFYIMEDDEKPNTCHGIQTISISDEEIEALKDGKRLYLTVEYSEYTIVIEREKGEKQ